MSKLQLTKTRLVEGVWHGVLTLSDTAASQPPAIAVTHQGTALDGVEVVENRAENHWVVRVPIPAQLISDGLQSFVISNPDTGETLESFAILAGDALADDIRAEIGLLRAELDMLKRAFRRHCAETA
jgi:hypothetical protein